MKKNLKFKQQWFEILNQCDRGLRNDVIEAVFQYFFSGIEPHFTDDARKIAFGFIRAEIDAANARSRAREAKKNPENSPIEEEPIEESLPSSQNSNSQGSTPQNITPPESLSMLRIRHEWNKAVAYTDREAVDMSLQPDAPELVPLLRALRLHGEEEITDLIRTTDGDELPEFDEFFRKLSE